MLLSCSIIFNVSAKAEDPEHLTAKNDLTSLRKTFVRECRLSIGRIFDSSWSAKKRLAKSADIIDCYNQVLELCSDEFRPYVVKGLAPSPERLVIQSWYDAHDHNLPDSDWDSDDE